MRIKDAQAKGAVWLKRSGSKEKRIRKATFSLHPGDRIELYYDPKVLCQIPPSPHLIAEERHYSVWFKPPGLLVSGTRYGDHCSLLRCVNLYFNNKRKIFPVHRLDREACGLVLVAHSQKGAAALSELFRHHQVEKRYRAEVSDRFGSIGDPMRLTSPLDGKVALTTVTAISFSENARTSVIDILLGTGRYHQIRRHLSQAGHPVVGDSRYGTGRRVKTENLQLCAYLLGFNCPFTGRIRRFEIEVPDQQALPPMSRIRVLPDDNLKPSQAGPESHEPFDGVSPFPSHE